MDIEKLTLNELLTLQSQIESRLHELEPFQKEWEDIKQEITSFAAKVDESRFIFIFDDDENEWYLGDKDALENLLERFKIC